MAGLLDKLALVFRAQGRETEAVEFSSRAQEILDKAVAASDQLPFQESWERYFDLGFAAFQRGQLGIAENHLLNALDLAKASGSEDLYLAGIFIALAEVYKKRTWDCRYPFPC